MPTPLVQPVARTACSRLFRRRQTECTVRSSSTKPLGCGSTCTTIGPPLSSLLDVLYSHRCGRLGVEGGRVRGAAVTGFHGQECGSLGRLKRGQHRFSPVQYSVLSSGLDQACFPLPHLVSFFVCCIHMYCIRTACFVRTVCMYMRKLFFVSFSAPFSFRGRRTVFALFRDLPSWDVPFEEE